MPSCLFESVSVIDKSGRMSLIGLDPTLEFTGATTWPAYAGPVPTSITTESCGKTLECDPHHRPAQQRGKYADFTKRGYKRILRQHHRHFKSFPDGPLRIQFPRFLGATDKKYRYACGMQWFVQRTHRFLAGTDHHMIHG